MTQDKAQFAGNGSSIGKDCNAVLGHLEASLRANRETALCCVLILEKDRPFPADDALHRTISRFAYCPARFRTVHWGPQGYMIMISDDGTERSRADLPSCPDWVFAESTDEQ